MEKGGKNLRLVNKERGVYIPKTESKEDTYIRKSREPKMKTIKEETDSESRIIKSSSVPTLYT